MVGAAGHPVGKARGVGDVESGAEDMGAARGQLVLGALHRVGVTGAEGDGRALVDEVFDDRAADAASAAGDQGTPPGELQIHADRPSWTRAERERDVTRLRS